MKSPALPYFETQKKLCVTIKATDKPDVIFLACDAIRD